MSSQNTTPSPQVRQSHPSEEDHLEIAEKIRTGEYFREARGMYDLAIHDPMAERYLYVFITAISVLIFLIALFATQSLYPLNREVPLVFYSDNIIEEVPHIKTLLDYKGEDPQEAVIRVRVENYVQRREEYDIATFDRDLNGLKSESSQEVYQELQKVIDPHNPDSPITLYQRHSVRKINILSAEQLNDGSMDVLFEATLESKNDVKTTHWRANVSFQFSGIEFDNKTGKVKPVSFVVTKYHVKRLQEAK